MYEDPVDPQVLYQGDIISNFPFFVFDNSQPVQKSEAGYFEPLDTATDQNESLHIVGAKKQDMMILSQSCDVQRRSNIILCPVYKVADYVANGTIGEGRTNSLRGGKIGHWFYLPAHQSFTEAFGDFQTMIYVPREKLMPFIANRVLSLSDLGRHHLAWALADYFGRPIEAEG